MSPAQYTVKMSATAETVYCELCLEAADKQAMAGLEELNEALDKIPSDPRNRNFQLAGRFGAVYRLKLANYCIAYRINEDEQVIYVVHIAPFVRADCSHAYGLFAKIVTSPGHQKAREALGIPETVKLARPTIN